ncbi:hypothetical protein U5801_20635 [Lamprobacter modestohalophilus]|uniref:hypothetical protein n=1 Tax=Lamprobacter modestohalophilus TaxID=1064514 RepID=UPI002ADEEA2B|nr:hypothetical protein [Lamprobacter modestohalophilus]MEA1052196.1 hypothetical protein [Lamprobacter modestohalophilus]
MTEVDHRLESIPRPRWQETCERFLNRHRGWLLHISETPGGEDADLEAGVPSHAQSHVPSKRPQSKPRSRELVSDVALHNLVFTESDGAPELTLVVGDSGGSETSLSVQPQAIMLERQGDADAGIRFEQRDGNQIRALFRVPASPEALDGLAAGER